MNRGSISFLFILFWGGGVVVNGFPLLTALTKAMSRIGLNFPARFTSNFMNFGKSDQLPEWADFKKMHNRTYNRAEENLKRMKIFMENRKKINENNLLFQQGKVPFKMRENDFCDITKLEFSEKMKGFMKGFKFGMEPLFVSTLNDTKTQLPKSVDWRQTGAVSPVKRQGICGACWAYSAVGALEGQQKIKTGKLVPLSAQQLVDCSRENKGCSGGLPSSAFRYIERNGIGTESSYPYTGRDDTCKYNTNNQVTKTIGYKIIGKNEDLLAEAVAKVGPISVIIDSDHQSIQMYDSGVYFEPKCDPNNLDHAVLIVGYDTDEHGRDYWIVKNSWGAKWGIDGYIHMARGRGNNCGIASRALYPTI